MVSLFCPLSGPTAARAPVFYRFPRSTCLNFLGNPAFTVSVATLIRIDPATYICHFREATLEFHRNRQYILTCKILPKPSSSAHYCPSSGFEFWAA